jgi:hypothetical protein
MNGDDPDWEEEARQGEAEENQRELCKRMVACLDKNNKAQPLDFTTLPVGMKLVVMTLEDDENPFATGPVEFTLLDPASGKVRVKDRNITEDTEGTLVGCEDIEAITPGTLGQRVLLRGKLKLLGWLVYEAGGKRFGRSEFANTIKRIEIYKPGLADPLFVLWED